MRTITLELDGVSIPVRLLHEEAPTTCDAIAQQLPVAGNALHDIWSGRVIFLPLDSSLTIPIENPTMYVVPGDVFFFQRPEHLDRGRPYGYLSLAEIGIVYGRDSQPCGPRGPKVVNLFGHIDESIEGLAELCDEMIWTGQKRAGFRI